MSLINEQQVVLDLMGADRHEATRTLAERLVASGRCTDLDTFLGDVRVDTVRPISAGNYSEFSKQGSASNWDNLDDTTLDSDSTYNYSNTVGQRDTLDCGNLPAITGSIDRKSVV